MPTIVDYSYGPDLASAPTNFDFAVSAVFHDLDGYITWVAANAQNFEGVVLETEGPTTEERARRLVEAMLRTGLATP